MSTRTSRRLIDALLIRGRLVNNSGQPLPGSIRYWVPSYHRGHFKRVLLDGKYCIKIPGYIANRPIRIIASSPGYIDLEVVIHPHTWVFQKGIFDGWKVVAYGDQVMTPSQVGPIVWWVQAPVELT